MTRMTHKATAQRTAYAAMQWASGETLTGLASRYGVSNASLSTAIKRFMSKYLPPGSPNYTKRTVRPALVRQAVLAFKVANGY